MTDSNPRSYVHAEVLGGVQRRRRWTPEEKLRMVEETFLRGSSAPCRIERPEGELGLTLIMCADRFF